MTKIITDNQKKMLEFLSEHPQATMSDIMDALGFKSRNAVHYHVRRLVDMKMLKKPIVQRKGWGVARPVDRL